MKIKECPFCGSDKAEPMQIGFYCYEPWAIACECGAIGPSFNEEIKHAKALSIEAWNKRKN